MRLCPEPWTTLESCLTLGTTARAPQTDSVLHFPLPRPSHNPILAEPSLTLPLPTMHPFDAAPFLSATPAEGSSEPRQQEEDELVGAASSPSPSPSRGTRAGGENAGVRCQDCRDRANAYCAHCCSNRGSVCPGHVKTTSHVPASQCSERQQTLAASASTAAVDVEPIPKRPRRAALPSVAAAAPTTSSGTYRTCIPPPPRRIIGSARSTLANS